MIWASRPTRLGGSPGPRRRGVGGVRGRCRPGPGPPARGSGFRPKPCPRRPGRRPWPGARRRASDGKTTIDGRSWPTCQFQGGVVKGQTARAPPSPCTPRRKLSCVRRARHGCKSRDGLWCFRGDPGAFAADFIWSPSHRRRRVPSILIGSQSSSVRRADFGEKPDPAQILPAHPVGFLDIGAQQVGFMDTADQPRIGRRHHHRGAIELAAFQDGESGAEAILLRQQLGRTMGEALRRGLCLRRARRAWH